MTGLEEKRTKNITTLINRCRLRLLFSRDIQVGEAKSLFSRLVLRLSFSSVRCLVSVFR